MKKQTGFVFTSESGNKYLQDIKHNMLIYMPMELEACFKTDGNQERISNDEYYKEKYNFLKQALASDYDMADNYSGKLFSSYIKQAFINTTQITFELTDACNLKCKYCAYGDMYSDYDKRENNYLSWPIVKSLLDYLSSYWMSVEFPSVNKTIAIGFYGGEPLLNMPLIKQIISYLENLKLPNIDFHYVMTTNGVLLDCYIDYLVDKEVLVSVSLDGNKENSAYRVTHDGRNMFDKIYSNILYVKNKYPEYFRKNIHFLSVLHNKNSMSDIYHFFKQKLDKTSLVSELSSTGLREDRIELFNKMYQNKLESVNSSKFEDYAQMKDDLFSTSPDVNSAMYYLHSYSGNVFQNYNSLFVDNENRKWLPTGTCSPFSRKIFLTVNGKILPCERIGQNFALGYVRKDKVEIDFEQIAAKYNSYYRKIAKQCSCCYRLKGCLQCLFHIKKLDTYPKCEGFLNMDKFLKYLKSNISVLERDRGLYHQIMEEIVLE